MMVSCEVGCNYGHMRRLSACMTCQGPQNSASPYDGGCTRDICPVDQSICHRWPLKMTKFDFRGLLNSKTA